VDDLKLRTPETRIAAVTLRVPEVPLSARFYAEIVGLEDGGGEGRRLLGGASGSRLELLHDPVARARERRAAGLFHIAFRYSSRSGLAGALARLVGAGARLDGAADHGVSEAIYLRDPSGNGVELTWDRPALEWPRSGDRLNMVTEPLDLQDLLGLAGPSHADGSPRPDIGHLHLQVTDLERSAGFYGGRLGLRVTQDDLPGALFLAGNGYHHHIGLNVWNSRRGLPFQRGALGLDAFAIVLPSGLHVAGELTDPDGIPVTVDP
jgi:catechol 2,3-dioxygenase